jgi:hypothetical protein
MNSTKRVLSPDEGLTKIIIHSIKASGAKAALAERTVVILQEVEALPESWSKNAKINWDASRLAESELAQKEGITRLVETNQTPKEIPKSENPFQKAEVTSGFDLTRVCLVLGTGCAVGTFAINLHQGDYFAPFGFPKPTPTVVVSEAEKVLSENKLRNDFLFKEPEGNNLLPKKASHTEMVVQSRSWSEFFGWKK